MYINTKKTRNLMDTLATAKNITIFKNLKKKNSFYVLS